MTITEFAQEWIKNYKSIETAQLLQSNTAQLSRPNSAAINQLMEAVDKKTIGVDTLIDVDFFKNSPDTTAALKMTLFNWTKEKAERRSYNDEFPDTLKNYTKNMPLSLFILYAFSGEEKQISAINAASPNLREALLCDAIELSRKNAESNVAKSLIHTYGLGVTGGYPKPLTEQLDSLQQHDELKRFCRTILREVAEKFPGRVQESGDVRNTIDALSTLKDSPVLTDANCAVNSRKIYDYFSHGQSPRLFSMLKESFKSGNDQAVFNNLMAIEPDRHEYLSTFLWNSRIPSSHVSARFFLEYCIDPEFPYEQMREFTKIVEILHDTPLLSTADEQARKRVLQTLRNSDVIKDESNFYYCFEILILVRNYPNLLSESLFDKLLGLSKDNAKSVYRGLEILRKHAQSLITAENINMLLKVAPHGEAFAELLTFDSQAAKVKDPCEKLKLIIEELVTAKTIPVELKKIFFDETGRQQKIVNLLRQFSSVNLLNVPVFSHLLKISPKEQEMILAQRDSNAKALELEADLSPAALVMGSRFQLEKLHRALPEKMRTALLQAGVRESSMDDRIVKQAIERFGKLEKKYGKQLTDESLEKVEQRIRVKLLDDVLAEASSDAEKTVFLHTNKKTLSARTDQKLCGQACVILSSNDSVAQIAWRAFEPKAETIHWPNLLTSPDESRADRTVFSTRSSTVGMSEGVAVTESSASDHARRLAALSFLACEDTRLLPEQREALWGDFKSYVTEIRRAHNENNSGIDDPSCFPGTVSRLSQIVNKHPEFTMTDEDENLAQHIETELRRVLTRTLETWLTETKPSEDDKILMINALSLYGPRTAQDIIDKANVAVAAGLIGEPDLKVLDERDKYIQKVMAMRAEFMQRISGGDESNVVWQVGLRLAEKKINVLPQRLQYEIALGLADLAARISFPRKLLEAIPQQEKKDTLTQQKEGVSLNVVNSSNELFFDDQSELSKKWKLELFNELKKYLNNTDDAKLEGVVTELFIGTKRSFFDKHPENASPIILKNLVLHAELLNKLTELERELVRQKVEELPSIYPENSTPLNTSEYNVSRLFQNTASAASAASAASSAATSEPNKELGEEKRDNNFNKGPGH